jgi:hypothetical protein
MVCELFVACELSCGMSDLVPWPGMEPGCPAVGAQSLSHRATRKSLIHVFTYRMPLPRVQPWCGKSSPVQSVDTQQEADRIMSRVGAPWRLDFQESLTPKLVYTQLSVFQQLPTSSWPQWVLLLEILSIYLSFQLSGHSFVPWPHFSDGSKKSWFSVCSVYPALFL